MWLMTPVGFFSAVEKPADRKTGMLTIRCRAKKDIDALAELLPNSKPTSNKGTDYPWRLRCTKEEWATVVARFALEIDYSNFKDEVKAKQGSGRAATYGRIWSDLLDLEGTKSYGSYGGGLTYPPTTLMVGDEVIVNDDSRLGTIVRSSQGLIYISDEGVEYGPYTKDQLTFLNGSGYPSKAPPPLTLGQQYPGPQAKPAIKAPSRRKRQAGEKTTPRAKAAPKKRQSKPNASRGGGRR